jgi:hypothetical protein
MRRFVSLIAAVALLIAGLVLLVFWFGGDGPVQVAGATMVAVACVWLKEDLEIAFRSSERPASPAQDRSRTEQTATVLLSRVGPEWRTTAQAVIAAKNRIAAVHAVADKGKEYVRRWLLLGGGVLAALASAGAFDTHPALLAAIIAAAFVLGLTWVVKQLKKLEDAE